MLDDGRVLDITDITDEKHPGFDLQKAQQILSSIATRADGSPIMREVERRVLLSLTPKGRRLMDEVFPEFNAEEARLVSALDEGERADLARLCRPRRGDDRLDAGRPHRAHSLGDPDRRGAEPPLRLRRGTEPDRQHPQHAGMVNHPQPPGKV